MINVVGNRSLMYSKGGAVGDERFIATFSMGAGETLTIPASGTNDFVIDWGDGSPVETITTTSPTHTYTNAGSYQIIIDGQMSDILFYNTSSGDKLISVDNVGNTGLLTLMNAFRNCDNLVSISDSGAFVGANISSVQSICYSCGRLVSISLPSFQGNLCTSLSNSFSQCPSLEVVSLPSFTGSSITTVSSCFTNSRSLEVILLTSFNPTSLANLDTWMYNLTSLNNVVLDSYQGIGLTSMLATFRDTALTEINLPSFVGSSISILLNLCYNCSNLARFNAPLFLGGSITTAANAFGLCTLDTDSYSDLLIQWGSTPQNSFVLSGGNSKYNAAGGVARDILTNTYGCTITDGGLET